MVLNPEQAREYIEAKRIAIKLAQGLLSIAEQAMPDTYFATDSRCTFARGVLKKYKPQLTRELRKEMRHGHPKG